MGKRRAMGLWTATMQRQLRAMTRRALRAGKRASRQAVKLVGKPALKAIKRSSPKGIHWHAGMAASAAGLRRYHLYKPAGIASSQPAALMVMLHGCSQNAHTFATSTRMNRLAAADGFMVLYPEQDLVANVQGCWNWYDTRTGRAQREVASIIAAIDQVCASQPVDRARIVLAGMSAGASMAALVALHQPERFAALAMHSGVGPGMASSSATAMLAMRGRIPKSASDLAEPDAWLPALLVIQGDRDPVVAPSNGALTVQRWAALQDARPSLPRTVQRGARYAVTLSDWRVGTRVVATLADVAGLGHAWSGGTATQAFSDPAGPDASRMVWAFAQRAFSVVRRTYAARVQAL